MSHLKELEGSSDSDFNSVLSKGAHIFKKGSPILLKGILRRVLGEKTAEEALEAVTEITTNDVTERLENYLDRKKCLLDFQNALKDYIDQTTDSLPLVFFIDELDRCRPSYAVEVLETIKHVFAVPGIVFVLSINKDQLGKAIAGYYGNSSIDTHDYLKRFIDLEFALPEPSLDKFTTSLFLKHNFSSLFRKREDDSKHNRLNRDESSFIAECLDVFQAYNLKLRDIEKIMPRLRLTIQKTHINDPLLQPMFIIIPILFDQFNDTFKNLSFTKITLDEAARQIERVLSQLNKNTGRDNFAIRLLAIFIFLYFKDLIDKYPNKEIKIIEKKDVNHQKLRWKTSLSDDQENFLLEFLIKLSNNMPFKMRNPGLSFYLKKYAIMNSININ